jgi:sugar lactone lactonase YvrE
VASGAGGRYRALLVGNSTYPLDSQNLQPLEGPVNDIALMRDALTDPEAGLFAPEDVRLLPERTMSELLIELETFFGTATRDDQLLLYYSGHGRLSETNQLFLCARDTRTDLIRATGLSSTSINMMIEGSPAQTTMIVLDCCHSGAFKSGDLPASLRGSGRFLVTSCRSGQLANDADRRNGTSMFTQHVVDGLLRAAPDLDADGYVSLGEVYDYVHRRLQSEGRQIPQRSFSGGGDVAIARRLAQEPVAVTGTAPEAPVSPEPAPPGPPPAAPAPPVPPPVAPERDDAAPEPVMAPARAGAEEPAPPGGRRQSPLAWFWGGRRPLRLLLPLGVVVAVVVAVLAWPSSSSGPGAGPADLVDPYGLAVASDGTVYVGDASHKDVTRVRAGQVAGVAGGGDSPRFDGAKVKADIDGPYALGLADDGTLLIAGDSGKLLALDPDLSLRQVATDPADANLQVAGMVVGDGIAYLTTPVRVLEINLDGTLTTLVGESGAAGFRGDGGPAGEARVQAPYGLALDGDGNLYFADTGNNRIRKVAADGTITTVAGNGTPNAAPDGSPAIESGLDQPTGLAIGPDGALYVAEYNPGRLRRIDLGTGQITTIMGDPTTYSEGPLGDGGPAREATLSNPGHLAFDGDGNLYVVDRGHQRVRRIAGGTADGTISTVA